MRPRGIPAPPGNIWIRLGGTSRNSIRRRRPPPGIPLATRVEPSKMNDKVPSEAEVEAAVRRLCPHRVGGKTHLCAEHFKQWRRETYPWEKSNTPPWRERWMCLVNIVNHMCCTGEIPQDLGWTVMVIIKKGSTGTRGIALLETLWKVVEALIYTRL